MLFTNEHTTKRGQRSCGSDFNSLRNLPFMPSPKTFGLGFSFNSPQQRKRIIMLSNSNLPGYTYSPGRGCERKISSDTRTQGPNLIFQEVTQSPGKTSNKPKLLCSRRIWYKNQTPPLSRSILWHTQRVTPFNTRGMESKQFAIRQHLYRTGKSVFDKLRGGLYNQQTIRFDHTDYDCERPICQDVKGNWEIVRGKIQSVPQREYVIPGNSTRRRKNTPTPILRGKDIFSNLQGTSRPGNEAIN
nr:MAG: hypothetical protein [Microvirus sp.]